MMVHRLVPLPRPELFSASSLLDRETMPAPRIALMLILAPRNDLHTVDRSTSGLAPYHGRPPVLSRLGAIVVLAHGMHRGRVAMAIPEEARHMNRRNERGRVGYLVLYLMGVPLGVLIVLWLLLGNNLIGPG
jgi:hypothetical protein